MKKGAFIGMLFHTRDYIHLAHLDAVLYNTHVILDDFYKNITELIDELVEATQADEGILTIHIPATSLSADSLEFLLEFKSFLNGSRDIFNKSFQQSIIDEIEILTNKTVYKLKYLK